MPILDVQELSTTFFTDEVGGAPFGPLFSIHPEGDRILALSLTGGNVLQILLTYLVPYAVSTWSAVGAVRERPAA